MSLPSIQEKLDGLDPGGTLVMERGDYGPCVINKPVILICDGATFWTDGNVPAVTVQSSGVVIKDAKMRGLDTASHVVISAAKDSHPLLQNIHIFGKAVGVEPEPAEWIVPEGIHTGEIPANHVGFFVDLAVPQRSQIVCRISGVSMDPSALSPGINTVKLRISDALPDSILIGEIEVIGSVLTRLIPFFARITASPSPKSSGDTSPLIEIPAHEKERFQKGLAGSAAAGSQPSFTQKSPTAPQTGNQKTQPVPAVEPPQKQPAWVSKPADKTQAKQGKRKSTPAAQLEPMKLGGAFSSGETRRLPVYILADCSSCTDGKAIYTVEDWIIALHSELMSDPVAVESAFLSVITFDTEANQVIPLTELCEFKVPSHSTAEGRSLGAALTLLNKALQKETRRPSHQDKGDQKPIVFIIIKGVPSDRWQQAAGDIKSIYHPKIIALTYGNGVSSKELSELTDRVYEVKTMNPNDFGFTKIISENIEAEVSNSSLGFFLPEDSSSILGGVFQSLVGAEPQSNSISSAPPSISSESISRKSQNQPHLSKLFSDGENNS